MALSSASNSANSVISSDQQAPKNGSNEDTQVQSKAVTQIMPSANQTPSNSAGSTVVPPVKTADVAKGVKDQPELQASTSQQGERAPKMGILGGILDLAIDTVKAVVNLVKDVVSAVMGGGQETAASVRSTSWQQIPVPDSRGPAQTAAVEKSSPSRDANPQARSAIPSSVLDLAAGLAKDMHGVSGASETSKSADIIADRGAATDVSNKTHGPSI